MGYLYVYSIHENSLDAFFTMKEISKLSVYEEGTEDILLETGDFILTYFHNGNCYSVYSKSKFKTKVTLGDFPKEFGIYIEVSRIQ